MSYLFIDIETLALPPAQRQHTYPNLDDVKVGNLKDPAKIAAKKADAISAWELGTNAALDPLEGRIACIGLARMDGPAWILAEGSEHDILDAFWEHAQRGANGQMQKQMLIGHNIRFDATYLVVRSWWNNVDVPLHLVEDLYSYMPKWWLDTMTRFQLGNRQSPYRSLDLLCQFFNIQRSTTEVTGATFGEWWERDKEAAKAYCMDDVLATRELWRKMP